MWMSAALRRPTAGSLTGSRHVARRLPPSLRHSLTMTATRSAWRRLAGVWKIRRVPLAFGAQCFVWTTPLHCAAGGYNLSFRSGVDCDAPKPPKLGCFWDIL